MPQQCRTGEGAVGSMSLVGARWDNEKNRSGTVTDNFVVFMRLVLDCLLVNPVS
jgi:hypothetical protein